MQAARLAAHFDTLFVQARARGDSGSNGYSIRAVFLNYLEIPAAFGALPSTVTVTTANGVEHWKGFELEEVGTNGGTPDSTYLLVAYRESDAHTFLLAYYGANGSIQGGSGLITNDTLIVNPVSASGTTSLTSVSGACATPPALTNPEIASLAPYTCAAAKYNTALTFSFPSTPTVDPALTHISFNATSFNGERLVDPVAGQSRVQRVREMLQRMNKSNRL